MRDEPKTAGILRPKQGSFDHDTRDASRGSGHSNHRVIRISKTVVFNVHNSRDQAARDPIAAYTHRANLSVSVARSYTRVAGVHKCGVARKDQNPFHTSPDSDLSD